MPRGARFQYRRTLARHGEPVLLRRYTGVGVNRPMFEVEVRARVTGYAPQELVGSIQQGDRRVIVLVEDLIAKQFALPVTASDKIVVRSKELAITSVDDSSRRDGTDLIALEIQARG